MTWPEIYPSDRPDKLPVEYHCSVDGCTWLTYHKNMESAEKEKARHREVSCPYEGGNGMAAGPSLIEQMWEELDKIVDYLRSDEGRDDKSQPETIEKFHKQQGQAQGLAIAIFITSTPHYQTAADVAITAGKRWKAKQSGETFDTPGVKKYNPMPVPSHPVKGVKGVVQEPDVSNVSEEQRTIILDGMQANLPVKSLARLTNLTESQVKAVHRNSEAKTKV